MKEIFVIARVILVFSPSRMFCRKLFPLTYLVGC